MKLQDNYIHGLKISPICDARDKQGWILVDVAAPRLVHDLVTQNVLICKIQMYPSMGQAKIPSLTSSKGASNFSPKESKLVQKTLVVVVEPANGLRQTEGGKNERNVCFVTCERNGSLAIESFHSRPYI